MHHSNFLRALRVAAIGCTVASAAIAAESLDVDPGPSGSRIEFGEASATGGEEADTDWAYTLAQELMSPFCPGSTLAACTSSQAEDLRFWMIAQAAAGASREEVMAALEERFGESIRPIPKAEGWGRTAFAVPLGLALVGGGGVAFALRRMVGDGADDPGPPPGGSADAGASDDELARRIDREIGE